MNAAKRLFSTRLIATGLVLFGLARSSNAATTWFVAPNGNNAWSGRLEKPAA